MSCQWPSMNFSFFVGLPLLARCFWCRPLYGMWIWEPCGIVRPSLLALRLKRRDSCDTGDCSRSEKQRYDSRGWSDALEHRHGVPGIAEVCPSFGVKTAGNCRKSCCRAHSFCMFLYVCFCVDRTRGDVGCHHVFMMHMHKGSGDSVIVDFDDIWKSPQCMTVRHVWHSMTDLKPPLVGFCHKLDLGSVRLRKRRPNWASANWNTWRAGQRPNQFHSGIPQDEP